MKKSINMVILFLVFIVSLLPLFLTGCSEDKNKNIPVQEFESIDLSSSKCDKVKNACKEIFTIYRKYGKEKVRDCMTGMPPFVQEGSINKLGALSQHDKIEIIAISKNRKSKSYRINCKVRDGDDKLIINLIEDSQGLFKLVGIN